MSVYSEMTAIIKNVVKSKKIPYKELCKKLQVSESTIKRILNEEDGSINKLVNLCEVIGCDFSIVVNEVINKSDKNFSLTKEQEEFFLLNPYHYHFFMHIQSGRGIEYIQKYFNLSEKSIFAYLKGLDNIGLVKLGPNNTFKPLFDGFVGLAGGSPLHIKFHSSHAVQFLETTCEKSANSDDFYYTDRVSVFHPNQFQVIHEKFNNLLKELDLLSDHASLFFKDDKKSCGIVMGFGPNPLKAYDRFPVVEL